MSSHIQFGFDAQEASCLSELARALRSVRKPLVYTVHDLRNPHHADRRAHDAHLDVLISQSDGLITLTAGAAAEVQSRWGRRPVVLPHPHVIELDRIPARRRPGSGFVVGVHAKSGSEISADHVREAAAATPGWAWSVLGGAGAPRLDDPWPARWPAPGNTGAQRALSAGADLLIFLDVDCVPGARLVQRYRQFAASEETPTVLCGPVSYLPQTRAHRLRRPHPDLASGQYGSRKINVIPASRAAPGRIRPRAGAGPRSRRRRPPGTVRPAAKIRSRWRFDSQRRAGPSKASIWSRSAVRRPGPRSRTRTRSTQAVRTLD